MGSMSSSADSKNAERVDHKLDRDEHVAETKAPRVHDGAPLVDVWVRERSALLGLCLRWTHGNLSEAEDLLGDVCLRVVEGSRCDGVVFASPFAFWATVINNLARDRFRRARRWKFESEPVGSELVGALPADTINAEEQVCFRERLAAAERQIACLTDNQRDALLLRCRGLDYPGIGATLKTSVVNARKLVETARRSLNEVPRPRAAGWVQSSARARGTRHHAVGG